ncbi:MAG: ABC transporter permease, partial [Desulforhabdus sp.]|nr:ABC transporter permease [Desulforhabdus sp.]
MFERIKHMLIKEFIQIFRDPKMKGVIFLMPVIQVLVFGYAVTTDVKHVATAVYDQDNSPASRELVSRFAGTEYFDVAEYIYHEGRVTELLDHGKVRAIIRIREGYGDDLRAGKTPQLQVIVDGTGSNTAGTVLDYTTDITREYSKQVLSRRYARLQG